MATAFSRTLRSLEGRGFRSTLVALGSAMALLVAWGLWFLLARVSLFAVTDTARLEVDQQADPLTPAIAGKVVATRLELGRQVEEGEVLVELDAEAVRRNIEDKAAEKAGLASQIERIRSEIGAQTQALGEARSAESAALNEARAEYEQAEAAARLAEDESSRTARVHAQGLVSDAERDRARTEALARRSTSEARLRALKRLQMDRRLEQSEKQAVLADLERQRALLEARASSLEAVLSGIAHELDQHRVRAPVGGTLGEVVSLQPGAVVAKGERLAAIVPPGQLRIVAEFAPPEALGRIRRDQRARLRLEGFPWVHYGTVLARVSRVASEPLDGRIRVELGLDQAPSVPVPLQHGLPGTLEVEVERISPAALVLRVAGRTLARPKPEAASAAASAP